MEQIFWIFCQLIGPENYPRKRIAYLKETETINVLDSFQVYVIFWQWVKSTRLDEANSEKREKVWMRSFLYVKHLYSDISSALSAGVSLSQWFPNRVSGPTSGSRYDFWWVATWQADSWWRKFIEPYGKWNRATCARLLANRWMTFGQS